MKKRKTWRIVAWSSSTNEPVISSVKFKTRIGADKEAKKANMYGFRNAIAIEILDL